MAAWRQLHRACSQRAQQGRQCPMKSQPRWVFLSCIGDEEATNWRSRRDRTWRVSALKWSMIKVNANKADSSAALISERSTNLFLLCVEKLTSLITRYTTGLRMNLRNLQSPGDSCSMCTEQSHSTSTGPCAQHKILRLSYKVHKMQNVVQSETATFCLHSAITKTGLIFVTGAAMFVLVVHYICLNRTLEYRWLVPTGVRSTDTLN